MERKVETPDETEDREIIRAAKADPDNPPLTDDFLETARRVRGPQKAPLKRRVTIRLDAELVEKLQDDGPGWQTRAHTLLRRTVGLL